VNIIILWLAEYYHSAR